MHYRRSRIAGGSWFFTVNLHDRHSDLLVRHVDSLRSVIMATKRKHPFNIIAMVVLPEHLHAIWALPPGDNAYPLRWTLIKAGFSRQIPMNEFITDSRARKRERGIWQRRYWEHAIRDDADLAAHVDYIHNNPVKHGHAACATDWPHSSIHRYIERGWLARDWGGIQAAGETNGAP